MKKIILFLLILLAIFAGVYLFERSKDVPTIINVPVTDTDSDNTNVVSTNNFSISSKWLDVSIDYPDNKLVHDAVMAEYFAWASDTQIASVTTDAKAKEMMIQDGMQYEYNAEYTVASSTDSVSYLYDIYTFTGGAHGGIIKTVYSFDKNGNKKEIKISDASIKKVLPLIRADIKKQMIDRGQFKESEIDMKWLNDGTAVDGKNYSTYWYDGENVVFYFGQYQVGPYVMGEFEVNIPIKSL